jgi:hypothetical protein
MCVTPLLLGELLVGGLDVVESTQTVEALLRVGVELAVADALEGIDRVLREARRNRGYR